MFNWIKRVTNFVEIVNNSLGTVLKQSKINNTVCQMC